MPNSRLLSPAQTCFLLKGGGVVAVPTETVYGLAAIAVKAHAVRRIFKIKGRPPSRPLILHYGHNPLWLRDCVWTEEAERLSQKFWPGPLTLILHRRPDSPICRELSGGGSTVAIRRSLHPIMTHLCDTCGPLAAPSANAYQKLSPTRAEDVSLRGVPVAVGKTQLGLESTILDLTTSLYKICRLGSLEVKRLQEVVECVVGEGIETPGSGRHYMPDKPLHINRRRVHPGEALLAFGPCDLKAEWMLNLSREGDLKEGAANLYSMLHTLSRTPCTGIAVVPIPDEGLGAAINDRLRRACDKP